MATLNINPDDLDKYGTKLGKRIREAMAEQYPETATPETVEPTEILPPAKRILLDPNDLPQPERINWQAQTTVNEGFTLLNILIWVTVICLLIPVSVILLVVGITEPGILVLLLAFWLVYRAGRLRERIQQKVEGKAGE